MKVIKHKDKWYLQSDTGYKEILLSTDTELQKNGIQAIDDEFLEWFVKNPSCEWVEVESMINMIQFTPREFIYKIIIPQEEPKQYPIGGYAPGYYSCTCVTCKTEFMGDKRAVQCEPCAIEMVSVKIVKNNGGYQIEEPKQETLEEAAVKYATNHGMMAYVFPEKRESFIEGAKWQQERMYSEAIEFAEWIRIKDFQTTSKNNWIGLDMKYYTTQELFEQFKKK
jgi:hypothetical protein